MRTIVSVLLKLVETAKILGLNNRDIKSAEDFLMHDEFGLCFDTLITQMYEYDIEIDTELYELISKIGQLMNLKQGSYAFMRELIRDECSVPKPVKIELARIIAVFAEKKS